MQSVTLFRWALTESTPTIKTYHEALWAQMSDYQGPIQPSLEIISGLYSRWVYLLNTMKPQDFEKTFLFDVNAFCDLGFFKYGIPEAVASARSGF